jgi:heme-binding protein
MKKLTTILAALLIIFCLIQLVPADRDNPEFEVEYDFDAPVEVKEIVVNSCYDCHSNQTDWPWYSHVAPTSWFTVGHVNDAREEINFSEWLLKPEEKRQKIKDEMIEEIEEGNMPLPPYLIMHPIAELTDEQIQILKNWAFANVDSI